MVTPNLAAQIEQLAVMKNGGALTEKQFDQALAKLSPDTAPSQRLPQLLTTILGGLIAIAGTGVLAFGGWLAITVINLNREAGAFEERLKAAEESVGTVEKKVTHIEILYRTTRGQADARRERQEESQ